MKQMIVFACGLWSDVLRRQTLRSMVAESSNQLQPLVDSPFLSPSKYPYQTRCFCKKAVQEVCSYMDGPLQFLPERILIATCLCN